MKKILFMVLGAAALLSGCSDVSSRPQTLREVYESRLAQATTFGDTLIAVDGTFIGGIFNNRFRDYPDNVVGTDRREVLRGIRTVMGVDTANRSYLSGLQMGLEIMEVYRELAAKEDFSKEKFLAVIAEAFSVDSLSRDELRQLQGEFQKMFQTIDARAKERSEAAVFNSKEAQENRMMGDAVTAKFKTNPDFREVGSDGLMQKTVIAGDGEVIKPSQQVNVTIVERHADSGQVIRSIAPMDVYAGRPMHPVLASVIPFMSMGEKAVFLVPYQLAYGTEGEPSCGVGPCETILAEVTVVPVQPESN